MASIPEIELNTKNLVDDLKAVCMNYGLGNDGNEYKIITYMFLYKFLNDKFGAEILHFPDKAIRIKIVSAPSWDAGMEDSSIQEQQEIYDDLPPGTPRLKPEHGLSHIWNQQDQPGFAKLLDDTLVDIARLNADIFSMKTADQTRLPLFEPVTTYVPSLQDRDAFAKALVSKLVNFSFNDIFVKNCGYDFFSAIFEYLIKDYNKDGGGKYAEYYTPHSVASVIARLLVPDGSKVRNVTCYDPAAGTGTLLIALAHAIGTDRCSIYSQDISQKSSKMLRLNLILNGLVHSIPNVVQGDTLVKPYHRDRSSGTLRKFDYIVTNPPFKLDFSDTRDQIAADSARFFAGVPKITSNPDGMAIFLCFIQHVIYSLAPNGKAGIVVPTGFIASKAGIEQRILQKIVDERMLSGVVSMPPNIFATTGTNVSILFLDRSNTNGKVVLLDASKLGTKEKLKGEKNQRTRLSDSELDHIVQTFSARKPVDGFCAVVSYDEIKEKGYSLSAGQYFDVKIEHVDITPAQFHAQLAEHEARLADLFSQSRKLEKQIADNFKELGL